MIRRPRCRSCDGRIWPWQRSGGYGEMGAKDNDRERMFLKHMDCIRAAAITRRAALREEQDRDLAAVQEQEEREHDA